MPELYAWRRNRLQTFIYMELINGNHADLCDENIDEFGPMVKKALQSIPRILVSPTPFVGINFFLNLFSILLFFSFYFLLANL